MLLIFEILVWTLFLSDEAGGLHILNCLQQIVIYYYHKLVSFSSELFEANLGVFSKVHLFSIVFL